MTPSCKEQCRCESQWQCQMSNAVAGEERFVRRKLTRGGERVVWTTLGVLLKVDLKRT